MSDRRERARPDRPRPSNPQAAHNPPDRIADRVHDSADRIALRRRAKIRRHGIGARRNAPDEHGLAEIAGLLRQSPLGGDVKQAAEAEGGVEDDAADCDGGGVEAPLEEVVAEDARLFQVGVQILQPVPNGPRHLLDDRRGRIEHDLVEVKDAAIELLVGIVDRKRHVAGDARAGAEERRQPCRAQPCDPTSCATHTSTIPFEFQRNAELPAQARRGTLLLWTPAPVSEKSDPSPRSRYQSRSTATITLLPHCRPIIRERRSALGMGALCRQQSGLEQNGG